MQCRYRRSRSNQEMGVPFEKVMQGKGKSMMGVRVYESTLLSNSRPLREVGWRVRFDARHDINIAEKSESSILVRDFMELVDAILKASLSVSEQKTSK